MLTHLVIKDFAVIEHVEIPFGEGFTVITGETGAGKSILVTAVKLVLGGRATADIVRAGSDSAVVEAIFEPSPAARARISRVLVLRGIDDEGDQLLVRRVVSRAGRNKIFLNNCAASLGVLREVTQGLVDISGQHEHVSLIDVARHVTIVDAFGGLDEEAGRVREGVAALRALSARIGAIEAGVREGLARADFLAFQVNEIDAAAPVEAEAGRLEEERARLAHAGRLREITGSVARTLYDGRDALIDQVDGCLRSLDAGVEFDPSLAAARSMLESAEIQLSEVAEDLRRYADSVSSDPGRLAAVDDRLQLLKRLSRKHGGVLEDVLRRRDEMAKELAEISGVEGRVAEATKEYAELERSVLAQARTLSVRRRKAARRMESLVEDELADLSMEQVRFSVSVLHCLDEGGTTEDPALVSAAALGSGGIDRVEFQLATSRAEPLRPLARIASGGELSRLMLAIKSVLVRADDVDSYIFDEVDAGIGGAVAEVVGQKIRSVVPSKQVICVTHLPQIAAYGDAHLVVDKRHAADTTVSEIRSLDARERVAEVARMLGGMTITRKTLAHAEEMIEKSR
jgi:DNA repair protein RecN (Recombination protein N)